VFCVLARGSEGDGALKMGSEEGFLLTPVSASLVLAGLQAVTNQLEKKGKVLPLFADKLSSMDFRPLEEAWLWQFHR